MPIRTEKGFERRLKLVCKTMASPWDDRNYRVRSPLLEETLQLPTEFDGLYPYCRPSLYDQGSIGSCVGWDGKVTNNITHHLHDMISEDFSPWWLYQRSRHYANLPDNVEGSTNHGLMKALRKEGACLEARFPTPTKKANSYKITPTVEDLAEAMQYGIDSYWYVNTNPADMQAAIYGTTHIASYMMPDGSPGKIPLITAFPVYESYRSAYDDGIVPTPAPGEKLLGGHSSQIRGWKVIDGKPYWINTGSWGGLGDDGDFYMPFDHPFYDAWIIHNGPIDDPNPTPSTCVVGNFAAKLASIVPWLLQRRGRFYYNNPT